MQSFSSEIKEFVRINSAARESSEAVINYVGALMRDAGMQVEAQAVMHSIEGVSKRQFNVVGILGDDLVDQKIKTGLLLLSHLDTSTPQDPRRWTQTEGNPRSLVEKDGKYYGLGVLDAKADFLCKIFAIKSFREKRLKMPVYLVGVSGSESGQFGIKYFIQSKILNPKNVLVGYPTGLTIGKAHRGLSTYKVTLIYQQTERDPRGFNRGVKLDISTAPSNPFTTKSPNNSILQTMKLIKETISSGYDLRVKHFEGRSDMMTSCGSSNAEIFLTSHQFEDFKRLLKSGQNIFQDIDLSEVRYEFISIGDLGVRFIPLNATVATYRIVDEILDRVRNRLGVTAAVNIHSVSQSQHSTNIEFSISTMSEADEELISESVRQAGATVSAQYPAMNIESRLISRLPPFSPFENSDTLGQLESVISGMGLPVDATSSNGTCEAGQIALAGYDAAFFGPGNSLEAHRAANESIEIAEIDRAIEVYTNIIQKVCI